MRGLGFRGEGVGKYVTEGVLIVLRDATVNRVLGVLIVLRAATVNRRGAPPPNAPHGVVGGGRDRLWGGTVAGSVGGSLPLLPEPVPFFLPAPSPPRTGGSCLFLPDPPPPLPVVVVPARPPPNPPPLCPQGSGVRLHSFGTSVGDWSVGFGDSV